MEVLEILPPSSHQLSPLLTTTCGGQSSCDTTPASACATQWFGNNASNFTTWMASKDCTNYQSVVNQLEPEANDIMNDSTYCSGSPCATNPQPGPYSDWNDIKDAANVAGLTQPEKSQFKRKMAKARYAQCQITDCAC